MAGFLQSSEGGYVLSLFSLGAMAGTMVPSRAALTTARKRLSAVVKLLAKSPSEHSFAFFKGLRLMGGDGTLIDYPDTDFNREAFDRTSNQTSGKCLRYIGTEEF